MSFNLDPGRRLMWATLAMIGGLVLIMGTASYLAGAAQ